MPLSQSIASILKRPDLLAFSENRPNADALASQIEQCVAVPLIRWARSGSAGGVTRSGSSHPAHADWPCDLLWLSWHRILCVDPGGTPLHECAWDDTGGPQLLYARPVSGLGTMGRHQTRGLVNVGTLDLSKKPGLAAAHDQGSADDGPPRRCKSPPEEIAFFYDDQSMTLDAQGRVTIRHRKRRLYILDDGALPSFRFMACMVPLHWGHIDFLPVVELFQSLLARTGSAVFELIRGPL